MKSQRVDFRKAQSAVIRSLKSTFRHELEQSEDCPERAVISSSKVTQAAT